MSIVNQKTNHPKLYLCFNKGKKMSGSIVISTDKNYGVNSIIFSRFLEFSREYFIQNGLELEIYNGYDVGIDIINLSNFEKKDFNLTYVAFYKGLQKYRKFNESFDASLDMYPETIALWEGLLKQLEKDERYTKNESDSC